MASAVENVIRRTVSAGITGVHKFNAARKRRSDDHPYLTGIHAPMGEELTLTELAVEGAIPEALDGRYLRIGPNPVTPPNPASYHWFVGDGMAHGLRIKDGKALWYRNRWIRSADVSKALGETPVPVRGGREPGNANTNILGIGGRTWALVEAGNSPVELDDELATLSINPFDETLAGPFSAHPHLDPETGELHAICYRGDVMDGVWHTVLDGDGKVVREEPIAVEHGPSIHDCAITPNFVLVFDLPVTFSMKTLIGGHPFPYRWNPEHTARLGLLPRNGTNADIRWVEVDPCYVFHPANAFEQADGTVIVDVVAHDRMFDESYDGPDGSRSALERWTVRPDSDRVERSVIDATMQEFPRFDERRTGKPYRYAYTMAAENPGDVPGLIADTRLIKHDLESGERTVHDFGARHHPGEFVFVPRDEDAGEDEGWLIGLVVDMNDETTELAILDAQSFAGDPVATIRLPHRIPPGFHGNWVAG